MLLLLFFPQLTLRKKPFSFFYKVVNLFLASLRYNRPFANKVWQNENVSLFLQSKTKKEGSTGGTCPDGMVSNSVIQTFQSLSIGKFISCFNWFINIRIPSITRCNFSKVSEMKSETKQKKWQISKSKRTLICVSEMTAPSAGYFNVGPSLWGRLVVHVAHRLLRRQLP